MGKINFKELKVNVPQWELIRSLLAKSDHEKKIIDKGTLLDPLMNHIETLKFKLLVAEDLHKEIEKIEYKVG